MSGDDVIRLVFIDGSIAGAQALAAGAVGGVEAVIIDPGRDGVRQIADHLARYGIQGAAAIAIVAHGASGVLRIGSTSLSAATLVRHQPQLARIGAALRPGGGLLLYGCDVARDTAGEAFLQLLSGAIGGANIAASSHLVGAAAAGGDWSLDVHVGTIDAAPPFTSQALAAFPGVLPVATNQLFADFNDNITGTSLTGLVQMGVNGSSMVAGSKVSIRDGSQTSSFSFLQGLAVDAPLGKYFMVNSDNTSVNQIVVGNVSGGAPTVLYSTPDVPNYQLTGLALDQPNHTIYFTVSSTSSSARGVYKIDESGGAATPVLVGNGISSPDYLSLDINDGLVFFGDSRGVGNVNNLRVGSLSGGTSTVLTAINSNTQLIGIADDGVNNVLYLTARNGADATQNFIYRVPYTVSGGVVTLGTMTTLYSGAAAGQPGTIAIDTVNNVFYVGNFNDASVYSGSLSGGGSLTRVYQQSTSSNVEPRGLFFESTPTVSVSGNVSYNAGGSAVVLASGLTLANPDGQNLKSATVAISGGTAANGETLAVDTTGTSISASYNSANETLTLTGNDTLAHYQSVLSSVMFSSTGATTGSRTINWTVSDGIITSTTPTSTVTVTVNKTFTATTGVDTFTGDTGNDTFIVTATDQVSASDTFNGKTGTDTIQIGNGGGFSSIDFSGAASDGVKGFLNVEGIAFTNTSSLSTVVFGSAQFGSGKISTSAVVTGSTSNNSLIINMATNGSLDLSSWTFANWNDGIDSVTVTGSTGSESIVGGNEFDTLVVTSTAEVGAGDKYDGGGGLNFLWIGNGSAGSIDFSGAASDGVKGFLNIGIIDFTNSSDTSTATFGSAQFGAGKISSSVLFVGSGATNALVINMATNGSLDMSGWGFANWNGSDTVTITGSTGIESIVGGSQNEILSVVAGSLQSGDFYDGGGGTNTLQVTSGTFDFSTVAQDATHGLHNMGALRFSGAGAATATFNGLTQVGSGLLSLTATVTGSNQADTLQFSQSGAGSLDLSGWSFANWTSGSDTIDIFATTGVDTYVGTSQDDTFVFSGGTANAGDSFNGGSGNDTLQVGSTTGATTEDFSSTTLTSIEGLKFVNTSDASSANLVAAQIGAGKLSSSLAVTGSAGTNALVVDMAASGSLDLSAWTFSNWTSGLDTLTAKGSAGNDTITGSTASAILLGLAGDDSLIGGAGNDRLNGGVGADVMTGGGGNDIYYVDNGDDQVNEASGGGRDNVFANVDYTLAAGMEVEYLRVVGTTGRALTGNDLGTWLIGNAGDDMLTGGAGSDHLKGGGGIDQMAGGSGNDVYFVDNADDQVIEAGTGGSDHVYASVDYALAADTEVEYLRVYGTTGLALTGNDLGTWLTGNVGDDTLTGGAGNDRLNGSAGIDRMIGGGGNDVYYVDNANDQVIETGGGGRDNVYASVDYTLAAGTEVEYLRVHGTTGLALTGNDLSNYLIGGTGNDTLAGGGGLDTFAFMTAIAGGTNVDTITDFSAAQDRISLDDAVFGGLSRGHLDSSHFALDTATGTGPQIVYNTVSGALYYDANGATAGGATQFAALAGAPSIAVSNIFVV